MKRLTVRSRSLKLLERLWSSVNNNNNLSKGHNTPSRIKVVDSTSVWAATVLESQPVKKKVKVGNKQAKPAEDLPPVQLPKEYVNEVVKKFYDTNPKVKMDADTETPMEVYGVNIEDTSSGSDMGKV